MSSQVTDAIKLSVNCCAVNAVNSVNVKSEQGSLTKDCLFENALLVYQNKLLQEYIPNGTVTEEGIVSSAIIDLTDPVPPTLGDINAVIVVNSQIIGTIPQGVYATLQDLITAIVAAAAAGTTLFQVFDNGDGISITIDSTVSGISLNGATVTVAINPDFVLDGSLDVGQGIRQIQQVNNAASGLYGHTLLATTTGIAQWVNNIFNQASVGTKQTYGAPLLNAPGSYALVYRDTNNTIVTLAVIGVGAWILDQALATIGTIPTVVAGTFGVFNPFNDCTYIGTTTNVKKIDSAGVVTTIASPTINTTPLSVSMMVDPVTGNVWVIGAAGVNGIQIIDGTTDAITSINTGALQGSCLTYYPGDGTALSERMFVTFPASTVVRSYNMDGTVDVATFYAGAGSGFLYSTVHNLFFLSGADALVIRMDGTLKQTLTGHGCSQYVEDIKLGKIVGVATSTSLKWFTLDVASLEEYSAVLADGTPDVVQTEADQCIAEADMNNLVQALIAECGCSDCGDPVVAEVVIVPVGAVTIYYGISDIAAMTALEIQSDLLTASVSVYAGTYAIPLGDPEDYVYWAAPASLGTPTRFYDPATSLDIAMDTVYQVNIGFITYNVFRSFYPLGGDFDLTVNS